MLAKSFHPKDITDVLLTHLHFDHSGGAVSWNKDHTGYIPTFENAKYWVSDAHWQWAIKPNAREKASFLKENLFPLEESGQLNFIHTSSDNKFHDTPWGFQVLAVDGHTEKMLIPHIAYQEKTRVFTSDLIPTLGHLPIPYVMGYDTRPLLTLEEKTNFLETAFDEQYVLCFQHDAYNDLCTLQKTEKGIRHQDIFKFDQYFQINTPLQ